MVATTRTKADKAQRQADQLEKKSERVLNPEQAKTCWKYDSGIRLSIGLQSPEFRRARLIPFLPKLRLIGGNSRNSSSSSDSLVTCSAVRCYGGSVGVITIREKWAAKDSPLRQRPLFNR